MISKINENLLDLQNLRETFSALIKKTIASIRPNPRHPRAISQSLENSFFKEIVLS
jgi:hypothetical protein